MDYKVFYRKYRPDSFKGIVGQEFSKNMLQNAVKNEKISHAYIFTGPRGTGKTSTAKVFAKAINCENPINGEACGECNSCKNFAMSSDIIEIDAASNNGVDEIRELINNVKIAPTSSKYKIYIIDEVHMMTTSAFNALLLTLEEPPAHVIFIMATTNIESVPITILSRCQRFDFKKFTIAELESQINYVCEQENIDITAEAALEIAYISEGGMRDALSLLDQLSANSTSITIENILSNYGSVSTVFIKDLVKNLLSNDVLSITSQFDQLKSSASDYKIFIKKLIQELVDYGIQLKTQYMKSNLSYEQIKNLIFELNECMNRTNININPYILIELVLLNYVSPIPISTDFDSEKSDIKGLVSSDEAVATSKDEIRLEKSGLGNDLPSNIIEEKELSKDDNQLDTLNELKKIRINNCFCGAKKDLLNELKGCWEDISTSPMPDDVINLLIDSSIVAASQTNAIMVTNLESTALLINRRIDEISDYLCEFFDQELRFIALTEEEWKVEKNQYIENVRNGVSYSLKEEPLVQKPVEEMIENTSQIEKIAQDIFNHDKIEIV